MERTEIAGCRLHLIPNIEPLHPTNIDSSHCGRIDYKQGIFNIGGFEGSAA